MRAEVREALALGAGTGATALLSLAYNVSAGRVLGPAEYAQFVAALSIINFGIFALGPVSSTVARYSALYESRGERERVAWLSHRLARLAARYGAVGLVVCLLVAVPVAHGLHFSSAWYVLIAGTVVLASLFVNLDRGVLRGMRSLGAYSGNLVFEAGVRLAAGLALLLATRRADAALLAYLLGLTAVLPYSRHQRRVLLGYAEPSIARSEPLWGFTGPMFLLAIGTAGFQNADILVAKAALPPEAAGPYGAAVGLAKLIAILSMPFSALALPALTDLHARGRGVARALLRLGASFIALCAAPLAAFALWPDYFVRVFYGAAYTAAVPLVFPLACASVIGYLAVLACQAFVARAAFRFLLGYLSTLILEIAGLALWHANAHEIVTVVIVANCTSLALMLGSLAHAGWASSPARRSTTAWASRTTSPSHEGVSR